MLAGFCFVETTADLDGLVQVTMNVDTSTTAAFRDPTDYQTRQKGTPKLS